MLSAEDSFGADGKAKRIDGRSLKKYKLSDYKWLTYGQIDAITKSLAKGLMASGVSFGDKVLILCETRVEWFLCAQAVAKLGGCVVTLFSNLGMNSTLREGFPHYFAIVLVINSNKT